MRIHVIFATTGRAEVLGKVLTRLTDQTRAPDGVLVVGTCPADVAGVENTFPGLQIIISEKGLCSQRNAGLAALGDHADVVVFFDDDFVPAHDFLEQVEALMSADPGIVGLTGRLVRDGAQTGSLMFEEAVDQLDVQHERPAAGEERMAWLYGCNMAIRLSANPQLRFDEALPLYGWQEDVDFSSRLARHGTLYRTAALTGIHLGVRGGAHVRLAAGLFPDRQCHLSAAQRDDPLPAWLADLAVQCCGQCCGQPASQPPRSTAVGASKATGWRCAT
ncbi:glycosyltransferase [Novosphingobium sp.]|uniref:glycosyltransferase family 2 protein n=1 Tax=Novosphingobium sp. TaxID=1874826 RepID=UPI0031E00A3A